MKKIALLLLALVISGCEKSTKQIDQNYLLPQGLSDCQIFKLHGDGGLSKVLYVVRCPNSSTSTNWTTTSGKSTTHHNVNLVEQ